MMRYIIMRLVQLRCWITKLLIVIVTTLFALSTVIISTSAIAQKSLNRVPNDLLGIPEHASNQAIPMVVPEPPVIKARSYILLDANSGKILAQKDAHLSLAPASLTKIMTLYIAFDAMNRGQLHLDDEVLVSKKAWKMGGSKMFIRVGERVKVRDLIRGMIIASGNDASVALAEHIAGSEEAFASLMNQQAQTLGMKDTHFTNCTGMPNNNHYSSAYDIALLTRALIVHFPRYYPVFSERWITYNGIKQPNRNLLLWRDDRVDGVKTGHTDEAGFCLAASGMSHNMRLVSVAMGTKSENARVNESKKLLSYGFRFFDTQPIFTGLQPLKKIRVWGGRNREVEVGLAQHFYLTLPEDQFNQLKTNFSITPVVHAPLKEGDRVGTLTVMLGGNLIAEQPVIALQDDSKGGFWRRFMDFIVLTFYRILHKHANPT